MNVETPHASLQAAQTAHASTAPALVPARRVWTHRLAFWGPIAAATLGGTALGTVATAGLTTPLRLPLLALLAVNLFYMALTGMPGIIGFILHVRRRLFRPDAQPTGATRTAVLMPIHMEDPDAVFPAIEVMARATADAQLAGVDFFVLSDTQDPAMAAAEQAAFDRLRARAPQGPAIHYRRRTDNSGRKAGNIADFCDRWGDAYDYMIVLDADSLMGASAISRLIGLMDTNPRTGIIQTVPYSASRETLFARQQQFAARLYTPLLVEGLTFWQQTDGNYWGHNAIIRIAPFRAHCTLPVLPGKEPWGGEILCHDVVEAGLMRGAGWECWVLPEVIESYESLPANIVDFAARERRWCQGNLQHKGVLARPGFRPVGRFHMAYGIAHYLAGPAAMLFLGLASIDAVFRGRFAYHMLSSGMASAALVALGATLLYAGKLTSLVATLADPEESRRYGGRLALIGSAIAEQAMATVLSALLVVYYTRYVGELLIGRTVRWDAQPRDDRGLTWSEAWLRMRGPTLIGIIWLLLLPLMSACVRGWSVPLLAGLLTSVPLAVFSSRVTIGARARQARLFLIPEETNPPAILRAYQRAILTPGAPAAASSGIGLIQLLPQPGDGD